MANPSRISRILLAFFSLILISGDGLRAGQQARNVLASTQVSPPPAGPSQTTLPFDVAWPVSCPCTVHVTNGSASSGPLSPTRITAGWVWIDNTLVMSPLQLNALVGSATGTINPAAGAHSVKLQLTGGSSSYVSIRISAGISISNLSTARANHTATLMPDGSVLFAGGEAASGLLSSVERLTSGASSVAATAPLTTARAGHTASLLPGGRVLIAGGRDASGNIGSTELLTAASTQVATALDEVRRGHSATVLADGRVLILGGRTGADVPVASGVIVDPRPDPFTDGRYDATAATVTSLGNVLQVARAGHSATLLADGRVLIIGGKGGSTDLSSIELFDPETNTSSLLPYSLATPRSNHTATPRPNGNVLVIGGRSNGAFLSSIERVRLAQGDVQSAGSINVARAGHTATIIRNGEVLIAGGNTASGVTNNTEFAAQPTNDVTQPAIVATVPADDAVDVDRGTVIGLQASEPLDPATVIPSTVQLRNSGGALVSAATGIADHGTLIAVLPDALLPAGTYTVSIAGVADRAGNPLAPTSFSFTVVAAPTITSIAPAQGTAGTQVTVSGSGFGPTADDLRLSFGTTIVPVTPVSASTLTFTVPTMPAGTYAITLRTRGGIATSPTAFQITSPPPTLTSISPSSVPAGGAAFTMTLSGSDFVSGSTVVAGATTLATTFVSPSSLSAEVPAAVIATAGTVNVHVVNPAPGGGTSNDLQLTVTSTGPTVTSVTIFPRGQSLSVGASQTFAAEAKYSDGSSVNVTNTATWLSSAPDVLSVSGTGGATAVSAGTATVTVSFGGHSAEADVTTSAGEALPPDPADLAPDLNPTESTTTADATRFLYEGENPIQRSVTPGAIETRLVSVIQGTARTRSDQPLPGVRVSIKDRPELGYTLTREDGRFDMAVNAGGDLVVQFTKTGLLPVDRRVAVPTGDFYPAADVVMIALDAQVTTIDLTTGPAIQTARGSVVTDDSGNRQATMLFPQGTTAEMRLPNGTTQALSSLSVRATEYTVGANGPDTMPASLPEASGYTHAVELSVDEAIAAGATTVEFNAAIPVYYENFLGFPIGAGVPTGYYDRERAAWVPMENGLVLKILSIDGNGRAELDLDGDTSVDGPAALSALGITDNERTTLGTTYTAGQSLWRITTSHFTTFDHNWPRVPAPDAEFYPQVGAPRGGGGSNQKSKKACELGGRSIIECQDQVLGERLAVSGTPYSLNYRSNRTPGYTAGDSVVIPLTQATPPASMIRVDLTIRIAGQELKRSFLPAPNLTYEFEWDRRDVYGRRVYGARNAQITIIHVYPQVFVPRPMVSRPFLFGQYNVTEIAPNMFTIPGREHWALPLERTVTLGGPAPAAPSLAGWSLSPHHVYDPASRTLFYGDGSKRVIDPQIAAPPIEQLPQVHLFEYPNANVTRAGIFYMASDGSDTHVYRQTGNAPPVSLYQLDDDYAMAADDDGVVYFGHCTAGVPRSVSISRIENGSSTVLASATYSASEECHPLFMSMARAPDGTLYLEHRSSLFTLSTDGALTFIKKYNDSAFSLATDRQGRLYRNVSEQQGSYIDRIGPDGQSIRVAGNGQEGGAGEGGPAVDAELGFIYDMAVGADGSLLLADFGDELIRVRRVGPDGTIRTIAGGALQSPGFLPNGTPATAINYIQHLDVGPDGWIYAFGDYAYRFPPDFDPSRVITFASEDGSAIYEFAPSGRHLRTINALTGAAMLTFEYDPSGRLTSATDGDGLVIEIQWNGSGAPTAIVGPYGQTTTLTTAGGWLSRIEAPGSRTTQLTTTPEGILTSLIDVRGESHVFVYDSKGRLISDEDPAGSTLTLGRSVTANGWGVTETTEMGRVTTYATVTRGSDSAQALTITGPDGASRLIVSHEDGTVETTAPDGTRTVAVTGSDPRFGLQSPIPASTTVTTPGGLTTTTLFERYLDEFDPSDPSTLVQYDYTTINGRTYETVFDGALKTFTLTSPAGRVTTSAIDAQGRVTRTQIGTLTAVDFEYDTQGRLKKTTQGTRQSTIAYDTAGRPSVLTDALSRAVTVGYDTMDRVTAQTRPDTHVIGFSYDAGSNMTSLTPPGRPAHTFTHTPVNLTSSYTPPSVTGTGPTGYVFNLDRQPTEVQRPDGQTTTFGYGPTNGRLNSVTFSRGLLGYGYDAAGRVSALNDPGGVNLAFTYDGALPLTETWSGGVAGTVARTFTNNFELATEKVNDAFEVAFDYDDDRLLTSAGALTITRRPEDGLVTDTTLGNTVDVHDYNDFGEPSRQTSTANSTQVLDVQITRDDLGRIAQRIETVDGITRVFQYGYDLVGRLETVTRNGDLVVHYTYDANGNRLSADGEGGLVTGTYDNQDRLLTYGAATYTYAANGELATKTIGGQTTTYGYDTLGNLIQVTLPNSDVITYTVDGRGRRVGKSINGTRVKGWLYADQLRPIAELDEAGDVVARFVYGTKPNVPEYIVKGGTTYRIFSDHLGSPRLIVDANTGALVQRLDFHPFGEVIQDSNPGWQPFGFTGGHYDQDTGLVRLGARDYDPTSGRWLGKDPIGMSVGGPNLYSYTEADPINFIDPTGLYSADDFLADAANFSAGIGDEITSGFGLFDSSLTEKIRQAFGTDDVVNKCSAAYAAGEYTGLATGGTAIALRGAAALGGTRLGRLLKLNNNRHLRVGPGRMPANGPLPASTNAPRISIGQGPGNPHIDLRIRGID